MCAIAGIIDLSYDDRLLANMLKTMQRRGPDGKGIYRSDNCALLHTRLAVIDPEGGRQPMELTWEGVRYVIIYNGELYNTEELRGELIGLKHRFQGHSDTEVVLHSYAQWGKACLDKFNGIFSFCVYQERDRKVFIARDRLGVKPLFYTCHEGGLIFASEIKTILCYPTVNARLDKEGAAQLILLGPGRIPGSGVLKGIEELKPGCCGEFEQGKWTVNRYWRLLDGEHTETFEQTAETVRALVLDAIRRQTVSDVPLGTFLSGGLDSSLISAVCAELMRERGELLQTFSVDYKNNGKYFIPGKFQPDSDNRFIQIMEEHLGSRHYWSVLSARELAEALEEATEARDLPGMADVDFSMLLFCKHIRKRVTVALSGECADEIFGGYPWYRDPAVRALDGFPWAQNTKHRAALLAPDISAEIDAETFVLDLYSDTVRQSDILPGTAPEERRMKEMVNLNQNWFMQTLLDRKDRMSMYSGLEVRVPFCDHRIAEYMYRVPWEYKNYKGVEKGLLRYAMDGILPGDVLWRKKSPYPKTYDPKYGQIMAKRLELLLERDGPIFQVVSRDEVRKLLSGEQPWPWYGQLMKGPQTMAYILQIAFWLEKYRVSLV